MAARSEPADRSSPVLVGIAVAAYEHVGGLRERRRQSAATV